jgi:S1-C subfamily serine protease
MSVRMTTERKCRACGAENPLQARFCHSCGEPISAANSDDARQARTIPRDAGTIERWSAGKRVQWIALAAAVLALTVALTAWVEERNQRDEVAGAFNVLAQQQAVSDQQATAIARLDAQQQAISGQVKKQAQGTKELASRVLPSVFTIETPIGGGSGFAAWTEGGDTILLTANHVVEGYSDVTVKRKGASWRGAVVETDDTNDLATIRVSGMVADALWQVPKTAFPKVGDTLVLFGSPLGYEGTVTQGIVSRVTYREIQTDAPANPGNSGGPAITENGDVAGVVVSGYEGRDISFAIPMRRVCVQVRSC